ncbi:MAG: ABC transporter ATP-binding protein [Chlamydiales bacterium]|nr:ABC transporter ATP-binding protein [Chlamydiales bacterium]
MSHNAIEIEDLSFSYEKRPILSGVNLSVLNGEFVAIFGPNGGGKTTFLKLVMGFLEPDAGEIRIFGTSPKRARGSISYVPQAAQFDRQFPLSVLDLVLMGCLSKQTAWGALPKESKEKALQALDKVGLLDKQHQAFGTLSGGQAQRTLIARALVSDPDLLILDEPTASVDPEAEGRIHSLLLDLKKSMTILMVTHDLQGIIEKADRMICIHRTLTAYTPKQVCEHFSVGLYHSPLLNPSNPLRRPT